MFRKSSFRYIVLMALTIAVSLLFQRYKSLRKDKASLIMLASIYPFDDTDYVWSKQAFCGWAETSNPDGFFQHTDVYNNLADAIGNLTIAEKRLRSFIPAHVDSTMWIEKSVSSKIGFHERRTIIPQHDRDYFQHSVAQYVSAFKEVLKQDRWKASIDRPEVQHEDSIKLDVSTVARDLERFSEQFRQRDRIVVDATQFDLVNPTVFELLVVLEHIQWQHDEIAAGYSTILRKSRKQ